MIPIRRLVFCATICCCSLAYGQEQLTTMQMPLNASSSTPEKFLIHQDELLFVATTRETGRELWKTDGTEENTRLVKDINLGPLSSTIKDLLVFDGKVYFTADDNMHGQQLWVTDGTSAGTNAVTTDVRYSVTGGVAPSIAQMISDGNAIYFIRTGGGGFELWKSDGTASGTVLVKTEASGSGIENLTLAGGLLYFSCRSDGSNLSTVWRSDGTADGTFPVSGPLDGNGLAVSGTSHPTQFIAFNGNLYFIARGTFGYPSSIGLMKSDGTVAGTLPLKAFQDGNRLINFGEVLTHNNRMYFTFFESAYNRFFIVESDGTPEGTSIIFDRSYPHYFSPSSVIAEEDYFYFTVGDESNGTSLAKFKLSDHSLELVKPLSGSIAAPPSFVVRYYANDLVKVGSSFFIQSQKAPQGTSDLWISDGTPDGTLKMPAPESISLQNPQSRSSIISFKNRAYFSAIADSDKELWVSDGTPDGTKLLKNIYFGYNGLPSRGLAGNQAEGIFQGVDPNSGSEPWITNGTVNGTRLMTDIFPGTNSSDPGNFLTQEELFFFSAKDQNGRLQIFKSDGTHQGTVPLTSFTEAKSAGLALSARRDKNFYFTIVNPDRTHSLFISSGTVAGTTELKNFGHSSSGVQVTVRNVTVAGDNLFIATGSDELWKSDGTSNGTTRIADNLRIGEMVAVNDNIYFTVDTPDQKEIYKSDGTLAGTSLVKDLNGPDSSEPMGLTPFGNKLVFTAVDHALGREFWITDGTDAGTHPVKDIFEGFAGSTFSPQIAVSGDNFYFAADDGVHGLELWKSDGNSQNTMMLKDLSPGSGHSKPEEFTLLAGKVYFRAYTPENGYELWSTDGSTENTNIVVDAIPGPRYSNPRNFTIINDKLIFFGDTPVDGIQLWSYGDAVTNVEESESVTITIFPNPSNGVYRINMGNMTPMHANIKILSIDGRVVYNKSIDLDDGIDLQDSPAGIYIIKIQTNGKTHARKVVKF